MNFKVKLSSTFVLISLYSFCTYASGQQCSEVLEANRLHLLREIYPSDEFTFGQEKRPYLLVKYDDSKVSTFAYKEVQENTVEIIHVATRNEYGHIILRVGNHGVFDFANIRHGRIGETFRRPSEVAGNRGFVFWVGKESIEKSYPSIRRFFSGSVNYNLPAFDGSSAKLLVEQENGELLKFKSKTSPAFAPNNQFFEGKVVTIREDGSEQFFLENPQGVRVPLEVDSEGKMYAEGYSCATSVARALKENFNIDLPHTASARNLARILNSGNLGFPDSSPQAIILYGPDKKNVNLYNSLPAPLEAAKGEALNPQQDRDSIASDMQNEKTSQQNGALKWLINKIKSLF